MHMADWIAKLDDFLKLSEHDILSHAGRISHKRPSTTPSGSSRNSRSSDADSKRRSRLVILTKQLRKFAV